MYFRISETIFELNAGRSRDSFTLQIGLGTLSNSAIQSRSSFAENKYKDYVKRVYDTLEDRLEKNKYLGVEYSIADIATWPWIARFELHGINLKNYTNVLKWYKLISKRPAVIKGYNVVGEKLKIPNP